jgi:hypothetical protein
MVADAMPHECGMAMPSTAADGENPNHLKTYFLGSPTRKRLQPNDSHQDGFQGAPGDLHGRSRHDSLREP